MYRDQTSAMERANAWFWNDRGSFTMESSIIFPLVFLIVFNLVFFGLTVYQKAALYATASISAERLSNIWDNSNKNITTGDYVVPYQDGLYWRTFGDQILDILGLISDRPTITVDYGNKGSGLARSPGLAAKKLLKIQDNPLHNETGQGSYRHGLMERSITVHLSSPLHVPSFALQLPKQERASTEAKAIVVEPVEFIRNIDMLRVFVPAFKKDLTKEEMKESVNLFKNRLESDEWEEKVSFNSHAAAKNYLQQLVHGAEARINTEQTGEWRMVDAMDDSRIAHQAYYGLKAGTKDIREQMLKDLEIMNKSQVNGVVWHFFRRSKDQTIGPTDQLRRELEKNGIVVVIHD